MRHAHAGWLPLVFVLLIAAGPPLTLRAAGAEESAPRPDKILTLEEAIAIALRTEPNIRARLQDYQAARARVNEALSPILPQLTSTWTANRRRDEFFSASIGRSSIEPIPLFSTNQTAQIVLNQILFDFGKTFAAIDVTRAQAEVARLDAETQMDQVIEAVKEGYFNLLLGKRLVTVNEEAVSRAELNLRSAKGFFEVGTRAKFDVTRAEVDLANAQVDLIRARNASRVARVALNTAMGVSPLAPTEVEDVLAYQPYPTEPAERLLDEALGQRPEYRRVNALVNSAEAAVRQAFRNFFPDISGSGSFGGTFRSPKTPDDLAQIWQLGLTFSWSIFDGGNKIARYEETKRTLEGSRSRVDALRLSIGQEVVQAHLNLLEAQERIGAARKSVESAQENFQLAQGRFDAGVGTIIELTDAQLALSRSQSTEAQALTDYRIAIARIERALGRR